MTVQELIKILSEMPQDLTIICEACEECSEPSPYIESYSISINYWSGSNLLSIPPNEAHVKL